MNKETIYIENLNSINIAAQDFIKKIKNKKVFAFYGEMGAGKTTFIKAICENLGVEDMINSPTFSIVNEYLDADGNIIYHMDCYRIEKESEATDIGVTGYLYSGNYCFIEWPEKIERLLPDDIVKVKIAETENGTRIVEFEV
ncbi:MAG: tRNA (adenosine(37)-N6)-threonylcarbamoyltransferase complex ATPase subunit type 1 TsaE [Paludibacter sp.]|nr:tRNA (adenosine(37)-N6)-threonylcarbamoyltransferase complex ATPase subunit type 1 TsaE [Paludibacter sp.]HOS45236.1 tRNA (adenosine(37)-N6)-threonylcarbamoyltransferase complex ATPase subunit type 1 TsaE [Paludibacter sp.]HPM09295.1 tRNA (adenosine(37)-N6)-threonylcarbamoyltransferase complex ATPase subunit type 1 TsaE [Paludibacter sp.]